MTPEPSEIQIGLCSAQRRRQPPGVLCGRPAGWGTEHPGVGRCKLHGGSTRNQLENAHRRIAAEEVRRLGLAGQHIDPRDALAEELARTRGDLQALDAMVASLELSEGLGGLVQQLLHATGMPTGDHAPHVLVRLRLETQKHYREVAAAAHRAGVEERRVQLEADRTRAMADLIRAVLAHEALGLTAEQQGAGLRFAAQRLRALSAGPEPPPA